jgi:acetyl-CoA C-acetyltransferase
MAHSPPGEVTLPASVIISGARTPIGKLSGAFASLSAIDLGAAAIAAALQRANVAPERVDYVYMGQILQAGQAQLTARQAAAKAGIPLTTPAVVLNKLCLSGLNSIYLADQMIAAGDADIVVAGGMESMTQAPYLLQNARSGYRYGDGVLVDSMLLDALTCALDHTTMGLATDQYNSNVISRERQDAFAARSHERAANAVKNGLMREEIVSVTIPQRRGDPITVDCDEGIRPETTVEGLAHLKPAFRQEGTITAGNASQISDGGAAVVVTSQATAKKLGVEPLGEFVSYGQVAGPTPSLLHQPANAINKALAKAGVDLADVDLIEMNEAFAAVALASMDALNAPEDKVNVNGGAIALGHPVGMSGTRLALTALYELKRRGGGQAVVSLCGGGGQGDALLLRSPA